MTLGKWAFQMPSCTCLLQEIGQNRMFAIEPRAGDAILCALPYFHIYGHTVAMSFSLMGGMTQKLLPRFEPKPQTDALKLDVPRTFDPPPLGPEALDLRIDPVLRSRDYAHEEPKVPTTETDDTELRDMTRRFWISVPLSALTLLLAMGPNGPLGALTAWMGVGPLPFSFSGLVLASIVYSLPFMVQPIQRAAAKLRQQQGPTSKP